MDLSKLPLFSSLVKRMDWLSQRQTVLARNIANADTPGYKPVDLKEPDFLQMAKSASARLQPAATSSRHMALGGKSEAHFREEKQREVYEVSPAGNAVSLEEQLIKTADTAKEYELMTRLYRKQINLIKEAIGRPR